MADCSITKANYPESHQFKMKMLSHNIIFVVLIIVANYAPSDAGPLSYGICQTGCNALAVACYAAAGFTFGTVTAGTGVPAVILGCNAGLGICMGSCIAAGFAPTP